LKTQYAASIRGINRYRKIIAAGDIEQFALRLAQNPSDSAAVIEALKQEQNNNKRLTVDFVSNLIQSGALDRWEIDEQVKPALEWLREQTNRVIANDTGSPESESTHKPQTLSVIHGSYQPSR
jgi:hypothetical protein